LLLRRALSSFAPGELRALHVADVGGLELVRSMLSQARTGALQGLALSRAIDSMRAIRYGGVWGSHATSVLIDRFAATLTQVDCVLDCPNDAADRALARCHQLESLANASAFTPTAWLGLSQLHTLRGVSFADVSIAAIAAALPRLHTIHAFNGRGGRDFTLAGFFDDLLPRLQSFYLEGRWPLEEEDEGGRMRSFAPLPRLQDFRWLCYDRSLFWNPRPLPRGFMGARPVSLRGCLHAIIEWLATVKATRRGSAGTDGALAQVRDLWIAAGELAAPDLARLLRAAPQLRRLAVEVRPVDGSFWLIAREPITDPAFAGLVHARLRHLIVTTLDPDTVAADCAFLLRERHFPRLRRFTLNLRDYPASMSK
jgi:hypothetical protein